jgi:hypothetical protein
VGDLKKQYLKQLNNNDIKVEDIRMYFGGKEMKDDLFIYSYEIKDDSTITAMIRMPAGK